jgi:hypothetical protein
MKHFTKLLTPSVTCSKSKMKQGYGSRLEQRDLEMWCQQPGMSTDSHTCNIPTVNLLAGMQNSLPFQWNETQRFLCVFSKKNMFCHWQIHKPYICHAYNLEQSIQYQQYQSIAWSRATSRSSTGVPRNMNAYQYQTNTERVVFTLVWPGVFRSVNSSIFTPVHIPRTWNTLAPKECPFGHISRAKCVMSGSLVMSSIKYCSFVISCCRFTCRHKNGAFLMVSTF